MLDRDETIERLKTIRTNIGNVLGDESTDRQAAMEEVDDALASVLEDMTREETSALLLILDLGTPHPTPPAPAAMFGRCVTCGGCTYGIACPHKDKCTCVPASV